MTAGGQWTERRLLLFTEYEDTRRWLERRLLEALHDLDPDERIASFTGATSTDRREELKRHFNAEPVTDPLRVLICTDAAREGINLQARCHDLIHIDLPWNPARFEQRNGRIDRKLQPSPEVWCRYFVYRQRPEDRVLQRLVEKTETIHRQLGSAGQVLSGRIADLLARKGLRDARVTDEIDALEKDPRVGKAREEMDDRQERRIQREARELDHMRKLLEESRKRVGVETADLKAVVAAALRRAGASLDAARAGDVGGTELFRLGSHRIGFWARRLAGGARRSSHPPPRQEGEAEGLACRGAAEGHRVRAGARTGHRRRCARRSTGPSRTPLGATAVVTLPEPGLHERSQPCVLDHRTRRAAARRAHRPPCTLRSGRRTLA
jgi:superfamily II DNA/RNA helicase